MSLSSRDIFVADGLISLELVPNRRFFVFVDFLVSPANVVVGVFLVVPMFEACLEKLLAFFQWSPWLKSYLEKCCSSGVFMDGYGVPYMCSP